MSSSRSSLPVVISAKSQSAMARDSGASAHQAAAAAHAVSLGNLQNFLRERVADLTKALEVKASTDFHDWLVSVLACGSGKLWHSHHVFLLHGGTPYPCPGFLGLLIPIPSPCCTWLP